MSGGGLINVQWRGGARGDNKQVSQNYQTNYNWKGGMRSGGEWLERYRMANKRVKRTIDYVLKW